MRKSIQRSDRPTHDTATSNSGCIASNPKLTTWEEAWKPDPLEEVTEHRQPLDHVERHQHEEQVQSGGFESLVAGREEHARADGAPDQVVGDGLLRERAESEPAAQAQTGERVVGDGADEDAEPEHAGRGDPERGHDEARRLGRPRASWPAAPSRAGHCSSSVV